MKLLVTLTVCLAVVLAVCSGNRAVAAEPDLDLVQDSRSRFAIVHPAGAPSSVLVAARELQSYVEKVTSAKLPIIAGEAPRAGPFIALGETSAARAAGITARDVPLEGFRL